MWLDIPLTADIITLHGIPQQKIDQRLIAANKKRISYDYQQGQQVLVKRDFHMGDKL